MSKIEIVSPVAPKYTGYKIRPDLQWLEEYPHMEVPIAASPDSFVVAVAGGLGNVSEFFWGIYGSATKIIEE